MLLKSAVIISYIYEKLINSDHKEYKEQIGYIHKLPKLQTYHSFVLNVTFSLSHTLLYHVAINTQQ